MDLIPKNETQEIIDLTLTDDEDTDIKTINPVKEGANSLVMNFYINAQHGEVSRHIINVNHS